MKKMMISVIDDMIASLNTIKSSPTSIGNIKKLSFLIRKSIVYKEKIWLTGIGKPGYIAQKQAATFKSVMIDAQYLDAMLAGHGDLGPVPSDKPSLLIAMSKSGCSSELYSLFKVLKEIRPNCKIVMICMSNKVQLQKVKSCKDIDFICHVDVDPSELDGYGIVPATSNALFEVIMSMAISNAFDCDELGMVDMCKRLQKCHPSGTLQNKVTNLLNSLQ